jgi:hypothetical protein
MPCLSVSMKPRYGFLKRPQSDIQEVEILPDGTPAIPFGNISMHGIT